MDLCDSVTDLAVDVVQAGAKEILKQTALATLITAVAIPYAMAQSLNMIDGTWTIAIERADKAGIELAKSLLESRAGHRPVTLVGFSMGARTILACLKELARHQEIWEAEHEQIELQREHQKSKQQQEEEKQIQSNATKNKKTPEFRNYLEKDQINYTREPASIVEDAILMGTPNHLNQSAWEAFRRIVSGRLINCYSRKDLILSLMFQLKRIALKPVCGTNPVEVNGVENYDVSHLVSQHSDYCLEAGNILRLVKHGQPKCMICRNSMKRRNNISSSKHLAEAALTKTETRAVYAENSETIHNNKATEF